MTVSLISRIIVDYTGDFEIPGFRQHKEREELCKKHGVSEEDLFIFFYNEAQKVESLVCRFALEKEVGSFSIQEKDETGKPTSKQCTVVVTRYSNPIGKHYFTPWLDKGEVSSYLGGMRIQLFTTLPTGRVCSILNPHGVSEHGHVHAYASQGAGCVYIEDLDTDQGNEQYRGIGRGLVQVAAEVSLNAGYDGRVLLQAVGDSPGFYRAVHFTAGLEPDCGMMKLDEEGRKKYREIIAKQPILRGAGAGGAAAKEESKSSKS